MKYYTSGLIISGLMIPAIVCVSLLAGLPGPAGAQNVDASASKQHAFVTDGIDAANSLPEHMLPADDVLWPYLSGKSGLSQMETEIVFELEINITDPGDNQAILGLGLHPEATEDYDDGRDVYSPPPFPGTFYGGIVRVENGVEEYYVRLYLPAGTPSAVWPIRVQAGDAGFPIDMSWDSSALPGDIVVQLQDSGGNTLVSMHEESQYVVEQGDPLDMQVFYTSDAEPGYVLPSDSLALVDFYFATGEAGFLDGWLEDPVSEWFGVTVEGNRVTGLELPRTPDDYLSGSLPVSIGDLDALRVLDLNNHQLEGELPEEIGNLTALQELNLGLNNFWGSLPASLLQLNELRELDLYENSFEGEWYTSGFWSAFPEMQRLIMGGNDLTGSITAEITVMSKLENLSLMATLLSGTLPEEVSQLTELFALRIQAPDMTGKWPAGALALENLEILDLRMALDQNLEEVLGRIPKDSLRALGLFGPFVDEIPEIIDTFGGLVSLVAGGEELTGPLPDALTNLEELIYLQIIASPNLDGPLPSDWSQMTNLQLLNLRDNNLSGELPESIGHLPELRTLFLLHNPELTGPIPDSYRNLGNLRFMNYYGTGIRTPVTDEFRAWLLDIPFLFPNLLGDLPEVTLAGPGQGETLLTTHVAFDWERLDLADYYQLELYGDPELSDTLHIQYHVEETVFHLELPEERADYYWQVRGAARLLRDDGNEFVFFGPWSEGSHFEVNPEFLSGPVLLAPDHQAEDEPLPVTLSWTAMESAETYYLEVSPVPGFDTTMTVKALGATEFVIPDAMDDMTYFWRVRGQVGGMLSAWSEVRSFTTELRIPEVPVWTPFDGEEEVETDLLLVWSPSLRAESYDVQLSDDAGFETLVAEGTDLEETEFEVFGLTHATTYYWKVRARNASGHSEWSEVSSFTTARETAAEAGEVPLEFALKQNYPNPFNPSTVIGYQLPVESDVRLEVYDMLGRRVDILVNGSIPAGTHDVTFDGTRLTSGVYVYRLRAGSFEQTRRMMVVK